MDQDVSGYCDFVQGVAQSENALLLTPRVFATFGTVRGADSSLSTIDIEDQGGLLGPLRLRLMAGMRYSFGGLYQGLVNGSRAAAECRRYEAVSGLHAILQANRRISGTKAALAARAAVLAEALPRAADLLKKTRAAVEASHATLEELGALQLRTDELRSVAAETEQELGALEAAPVFPKRPIAELLRARALAEDEVERHEARLRQAQAWDFSIRGGYDQVFEDTRDRFPFFGLASVSLSIGGLWQGSGDTRARAGRMAWLTHEAEGLDQRVQQLMGEVRAAQTAEQRRLGETTVLLRDIEQRMKALASLQGEKVQKLRDYLWFDLVKVRAEHAYLAAHVQDLAGLLQTEK